MDLRKQFKRLCVVLILLAVLMVLIPLTPGQAWVGTSAGGGVPFGGKVTVIPCPCSFNRMLIVGSPKGGTFMLTSGSKVFAAGGVSSGDWVLGLASGGSVCLIPISKKPWCIPIGGGPVVQIIGSS